MEFNLGLNFYFRRNKPQPKGRGYHLSGVGSRRALACGCEF